MIARRPEVERMTGLSRASIYRMMHDGEFPVPIRLGVRAIGWRVADVEEWLRTRSPANYDRAAGKRVIAS